MKKREPLYIAGENAFWCSYSGHHYGSILKQVKIVTVWSRNPTLGIYLGKTKSNLKRCTCPNVYSSTIYDSQGMKAAWVYQQIRRCVHMYVYIYIYTYTYIKCNINQSKKKNQIMPFATTWMNLGIIRLSKSDRERKFYISFICKK